MHYYQVPRLGSYLAIRLEYNSCLFEAAFDAALEDYSKVQTAMKQQEKEKKEMQDQQNEARAVAEEAEESYEEEEKDWPSFKHSAFKTKKKQFVICLNTLGQDRQFTEEEVNFALKTVQQYRDAWEELERKNLKNDVELKLKYTEFDRFYKEHYSVMDDQKLADIIEDAIAGAEAGQIADGEDPLTDLEKEKITKITRFTQITKAFHAPEDYVKYKADLDMKED